MKKLLSRLFGDGPGSGAPLPPAVPKQAQSTDSHETILFRPLHGGAPVRGVASWRTGPDTRVAFNVWDGPDAAASGLDLFEALLLARRKLEAAGSIPMIAGARRDCYPSGLARGMGEGEMIYRLHPGTHASDVDLVFLFDAAEPDAVTTVEAQEAAYRRWLASVPDEEA
jgi:hypothetical protein